MDATQVLQITLGLQVMQLMAWLYIVYLLRGKQPKRKEFPQIVKRYPDWSEPGMHPTPVEVLDIEEPFARYLLYHGTSSWTEEKLYPMFQEAGGTSKTRMREVLRKWQAEGILIKGPATNNTRKIAERGAGWKKLKEKFPPAPSSSTPKTGGNMGKKVSEVKK